MDLDVSFFLLGTTRKPMGYLPTRLGGMGLVRVQFWLPRPLPHVPYPYPWRVSEPMIFPTPRPSTSTINPINLNTHGNYYHNI